MAGYNLKVGISIATGPRANVEVAALADSLGYDSIWVGDHVGFDRYEFEALTMLTAYAMVTRHVSLGVAVLVLPLRQPVVLAKTCASIDQLAHGRLILGVGAGGDFPEQYRACGV